MLYIRISLPDGFEPNCKPMTVWVMINAIQPRVTNDEFMILDLNENTSHETDVDDSPNELSRVDSMPLDPLLRPLWPAHNLARNPFGELTRKERAKLAVVNVGAIKDFLSQPLTAHQFIGECGRGKTTRMLALHQQIVESSYTYLPEDEPCPSIPSGSIVMIDEAQRLPRRVRNEVFRSGLPLLLATHRDLTRPLRRAGYLVKTERIGETLTAHSLAQILNARINASQRDEDSPVKQIHVSDCETLLQRFGTNIRAIESYLYDVVQTQVNSHGEMRFIDHA